MRRVDVAAFSSWLERYFAAWASNDPEAVASLFAEDAEYSFGPFRPSAHGRDEIVRRWVDGGAPPGVRTSYDIVAVTGDRGVAHWRVTFDAGDGAAVELDGILVCTFDADGRCTLHREWYDRRETPGA